MTAATHPRFRKLKGRMAYQGLLQADLAKAIDRSAPYITDRMSGKKDWELGECYKILDVLDLKKEELQEYFPPA